MRLDQAFATGKPTISFEFFPPKTEEGFAALYKTIDELRPLRPSYVSVTYGAGGSTRSKTIELCGRIQNEIGFNTVAHLTCVGHTADEIGQILDQLWASGIRNILALRGDPQGTSGWVKTEGGFDHADELVAYVRGRKDFFVAVAGFPEGHPQCLNRQRDMEHLKRKVDAGASAIVTQLFFDNNDFHRFRDDCDRHGVRVPIIAGIMPISNVAQIKRFVTMCGAKIPMPLLQKLERIDGDPDRVYNAGIDYATNQCRDLLFHDVAGLHFYTLNKSKATTEIVQRLNAPHA
jgi:methylenetetrahydrofolate reductase (NADPH)